ncbi:ATP-binding cassette domain-containing protein [Gulosibacter faecalis]|jgi:peptide/nickel transport system ATP-binding protein|uniref:ATP-binding cassette domain-containing protein n=1 Tax=Gulosibacter faecalis TaxID=272240 RepID=A0ABW5V189_9MICO|nr:ATP-binding cassette domain-containing protein [Gulosibacter faecalis]
MSSVIRARDLSISYGPKIGDAGARVLSGVNIELGEGEILGVVGSAGSGKTSLGRVLSGRGLLRGAPQPWPWISGGELHVDGADLRRPTRADLRRLPLTVGYLAPNSGQTMRNDLTVAENIAEPVLSRDRQFDRRALGRAAALLIDAVDLELGVLNRFPYELSRGQRQRVAFARALIVEPRLLIVDEPAQGVDVIARPALFELLERLNRGRTLSMVVISNDLATIERLTSRVLVTNRGTVIARGEIDRVLRDPFDSYLRRMRDAREFARAPLPGLVDRELVAAAERVAGGLFLEEDPEQVAAAERERLLEERPEFARFHTPAGENPTQSNEETRK